MGISPRNSLTKEASLCVHFYRPQRSCGQGYVFTRVCDSVNKGGVSEAYPPEQTPPDQTPPEQTPPLEQTPPGTRPPQEQTPPPPRDQTPPGPDPLPRSRPPREQTADTPLPPGSRPPRERDSGIRSMSGRYASYWNAFLLVNERIPQLSSHIFLCCLLN